MDNHDDLAAEQEVIFQQILTPLRSYAELLIKNGQGDQAAKLNKQLERLERGNTQLFTILENLEKVLPQLAERDKKQEVVLEKRDQQLINKLDEFLKAFKAEQESEREATSKHNREIAASMSQNLQDIESRVNTSVSRVNQVALVSLATMIVGLILLMMWRFG